SSCVRIGISVSYWPSNSAGLPISQICYSLPYHQLFAWRGQVDSDALNTFLTVHRRGSVSNAAQALHRSHPAISRRIALLEQELGVPLFERVAGPTRLSAAGRVMVPSA